MEYGYPFLYTGFYVEYIGTNSNFWVGVIDAKYNNSMYANSYKLENIKYSKKYFEGRETTYLKKQPYFQIKNEANVIEDIIIPAFNCGKLYFTNNQKSAAMDATYIIIWHEHFDIGEEF